MASVDHQWRILLSFPEVLKERVPVGSRISLRRAFAQQFLARKPVRMRKVASRPLAQINARFDTVRSSPLTTKSTTLAPPCRLSGRRAATPGALRNSRDHCCH